MYKMRPDGGAGGHELEADLCVVGAGIVGLAHAHEARRRGLRVAVLERNRRAVGASVRNFGHAFVAAVADGDDLECALRARERWLELGGRAGLTVQEAGTLVVARDDDELEVLEGAATNPRRGARVVSAAEAGGLAPVPTGDLVGALHASLDLRLDPRRAVAGLAALLEQDDQAHVEWGARVHEVEPGAVHSAAIRVRAPWIVVCPGPDYAGLPPAFTEEIRTLTLCKLQMMRIAAPGGRRYGPTLATGLSTIRYPAFAAQPAAARVRERLLAERPELVEAGIHLLVAQLPDGDLIIGDTHRYGEPVSPFSEVELDELLLAEARRLLGAQQLTVRERWLGIYPTDAGGRSSESGHFTVGAPFEGTRIVEVTSGLGMTMALGGAHDVLDELERSGGAAGQPQLVSRDVGGA